MIVFSDICTINYISVNDTCRVLIDNSRATLQIVASLTDDSKGITYDIGMAIGVILLCVVMLSLAAPLWW